MHHRQLLHTDETQLINPAGPTPWRTFQEAFNHLLHCIDLAGHTITLQSLTPVTGDFHASGHPGSGGKIVISAPAGWSNGVIYAEHGARLHVRETTLLDVSLYAEHCGRIDFDTVTFGQSSRGHIEAHNHGHIRCLGHYSITGGGKYHLHATSKATILFPAGGGWLTNYPHFTEYFVGCSSGDVTFGLDFAFHTRPLPNTPATCGKRKALIHNGGNVKTLRQGTPEYETFLPGTGEITTVFGNSIGWYT